MSHRPVLNRYLVEWYRPDLTDEQLEQTARAIGDSAEKLATEGVVVDLLRTFFVPSDEVVFSLFAAASMTSVEQVCQRAGCPFDRIAEAIESGASGHSPAQS